MARAIKALHREFETLDEGDALRERNEAYTREFNGKNAARRAENTIAWDENSETAET